MYCSVFQVPYDSNNKYSIDDVNILCICIHLNALKKSNGIYVIF